MKIIKRNQRKEKNAALRGASNILSEFMALDIRFTEIG